MPKAARAGRAATRIMEAVFMDGALPSLGNAFNIIPKMPGEPQAQTTSPKCARGLDRCGQSVGLGCESDTFYRATLRRPTKNRSLASKKRNENRHSRFFWQSCCSGSSWDCG